MIASGRLNRITNGVVSDPKGHHHDVDEHDRDGHGGEETAECLRLLLAHAADGDRDPRRQLAGGLERVELRIDRRRDAAHADQLVISAADRGLTGWRSRARSSRAPRAPRCPPRRPSVTPCNPPARRRAPPPSQPSDGSKRSSTATGSSASSGLDRGDRCRRRARRRDASHLPGADASRSRALGIDSHLDHRGRGHEIARHVGEPVDAR